MSRNMENSNSSTNVRHSETKKSEESNGNNFKGEMKMATQIAATPILRGEQARIVLREAKTVPSKKAKQNASKLLNYFKEIAK